ncbi:MAG: Gfo/Idh/MocA family protein [Geminicoccaceae bacterium]
MDQITIGVIGTGFMGKCHALAFRAVPAVFPDAPLARLELLADVDPVVTERAARSFGFARWTTDWRALVADPAVALVAIATPNFLHEEMALAAIAAGKHVYCEKPLALDARGAKAMADAAESAGVRTLVGYNYLRNPATRLAREIIQSGEIGEIVHFKGAHLEDYMSDPEAPFSWRCKKTTAGAGAVADLGSHAISLARFLVGEITEACGSVQTMIKERPLPGERSRMGAVEVDDQAQALVRFEGGAAGTLEASWIAAGRKMALTYEVTGTKGALMHDQERMNELRLFSYGHAKRLDGFKTILTGPEHPDYGAFCPAAGHQLGFNDLKVIEVKDLLEGIARRAPLDPDFRGAWKIARVVDAILLSAAEGRPVEVAELGE